MPNFVTDPDNNKKVVMGGYSVNDKSMKASQQLHCTMSAPPSYVIVADGDGSNDSIGFFFGSSASFAEKAVIEGNSSVAASVLTGSANYVSFGAGITTGTKLDISPLAWSGSAAMKVVYVYNARLQPQRTL